MNIPEILTILRDVKFQDYKWHVGLRGSYMYLQAEFPEKSIATGEIEIQKTRKWFLSEHMTKSEVVQTAWKLVLTSIEHEAREAFKYKERRIFGPHFDVDSLHRICTDREFDIRKEV